MKSMVNISLCCTHTNHGSAVSLTDFKMPRDAVLDDSFRLISNLSSKIFALEIQATMINQFFLYQTANIE